MELREFIKQTICQITDGIRDGHAYVEEGEKGDGFSNRHPFPIKFDVAITSTEEETTGLGGGLQVANLFSFKGNTDEKQVQSHVSRIQFEIHLHVK